MNCVDAKFLKSCPIPKSDAGVDERNFDEVVKRIFLLFGQVRTKVRDGHVPAGEDAAFGTRGENFAGCCIRDDNLLRGFTGGSVLRSHDGAVKTDTGWVCWVVEAIVRDLRCNSVFNGVPWHSFGNQFANEQPRDGRIAVGKMKTRRASGGVACRGITHARSGTRIEIHSLKTGKAKRPTIEGRFRVNTDAPFTVRACLIERDDCRVDLCDRKQEIFVTDARELVFFFR